MKRFILGLGLVALAVITAACSGGGTRPPRRVRSPGVHRCRRRHRHRRQGPHVLADVDHGNRPDEAFQIVLDNQESAPHNIAIKDAAGAEMFKGEIVTPTKITYDVPALTAGTYTFWCEVHPEMTGTLTAG